MKTENYYDEVLEKMKSLISKDKNKEAMKILKEELSMPYIPQKYEEQFHNLYEQLFLATVKEIKGRGQLSPEDVVELLNSGDPIEESMAVDELHNINIRQIQEDLKKWIETKGKDKQIGKAFIVETMIAQKIDIDITLNGETINPSKDKSILESEEIIKAFSLVDTFVEKEPQLRDVVFSEIKRYLLLTYPIAPTDANGLAEGVTNVVRHMMNNEVELSGHEKEILNKLNS